jgi:hypothetical protein
VDQGRTRARSARVRADPSLPQIWAADGCVLPPDTFGSARWTLFFWLLCPVGQKQTRGVRLDRPAGDGLSIHQSSSTSKHWANKFIRSDLTCSLARFPFRYGTCLPPSSSSGEKDDASSVKLLLAQSFLLCKDP